MSTPDASRNGYQLWHYFPSIPAGIAMAAIFGLLTCVHAIFLVKQRTWFCIPLVIGGILEAGGYAARAIAHNNINATLPYAIQSLLILLAPILFAASVYMYLGRIIAAVRGEHHCLIRLRWLTKIFVCGDITCFLMQGAGGGIMSGAKSVSRLHLGENVILAGLCLQILIFLVFVAVAAFFHIRMRAMSTAEAGNSHWQRLLVSLYAVSVLITIRNVIRAVEYGLGSDGYFLVHEWTTYVFDAALMAVVLVICLMWYKSGVGAKDCASGEIGSVHAIEEEPKSSV